MKKKYYYCSGNGLIYRNNGDGTEQFLLPHSGVWEEPCGDYLTRTKFGMSPISPVAVRHFERSGGYIQGFRDSI